jgi:thymidylate synthase
MELSLIVSFTNNSIISIGDEIPKSSIDLDNFRTITRYSPDGRKNLLIVGRKTWETLPNAVTSDTKRAFLMLTTDTNIYINANTYKAGTLDEAIKFCYENKNTFHKIFVIGGKQIYETFINTGLVTEFFITKFNIPWIVNNTSKKLELSMNINVEKYDIMKFVTSDKVKLLGVEANANVELIHATKKYKSFELQYMELIKKILASEERQTRNSITKNIPHASMVIDLSEGFPILTTRKIFWRGVKEELFWMLSGSTNVQKLKDKNIHIWDGNSSEEFLRKNKLPYAENDIGPGYGFHFRNTGAKYIDHITDYTNQGIDQVANCIRLLKTDPMSRRILINLWHTPDVPMMALPPCPLIYQFSVSSGEKTKLNCTLYQRSWDVMLGWNVTTAALLTHLIANECDMNVGVLYFDVHDPHIYKSHFDSAVELLHRIPYKLPTLQISGKTENLRELEKITVDLVNYVHGPEIKMSMIA